MRHPRIQALAATLAFPLAVAAQAQGTWGEVAVSPPVQFGEAAYDSARGQHVLFGEGQTWEWDGAWVQRSSSFSPSARDDHAMAYDAARGVVVLFGGASNAQVLSDTWEWDGSSWSQRAPASAPSPRRYHSMVYDPTRGVVVLHGGSSNTETWTWDGVNWTQVFPSTQPPYGGSVAFDAARDEVVLFTNGETWTWDGIEWTLETVATSPPTLRAFGMAFDVARARSVFVGETVDGTAALQTWEWDGAGWTRALSATRPPGGRYQVTFDAGLQRVTLFGGLETWLWDGVDWQRYAPRQFPTDRGATCYDPVRAQVLMFGGTFTSSDETWSWNGTSWTELLLGTRPSELQSPGLAFDRRRGRAVLFGQLSAAPLTSELWEWDGVDWTQRIAPSSQDVFGPLAYDDARGETVVLGQGETWTWDGSAWSLHPTAPAPAGVPLVYDSAKRRVVAVEVGGSLLRIHEWDGSAWATVHEQAAPPRAFPWGGVSAVYDPGRRLTWVHYVDGSAITLGAWTGTGFHWFGRDFDSPPGLTASVAFDEARGELLSIGGCPFPLACPPETWVYRPGEPALVDVFGAACQGTTLPSLTTGQAPRIGGKLAVRLNGLPPFGVAGLLGPSATTSGPLELPLDLDGLGMLGCALRVDPMITRSLPVVGGTAKWTIEVPRNTALLGTWFYGQGLVLDPGGNPAGATTTEAFAARVGR